VAAKHQLPEAVLHVVEKIKKQSNVRGFQK